MFDPILVMALVVGSYVLRARHARKQVVDMKKALGAVLLLAVRRG